jgi:purine-binding chemotaxis protein CheW
METAMTESTHRQLVVFSLGDGEYALPIEDVHEVIGYIAPRGLGSEGRVVNVRGTLVPIFDLAGRLGVDLANAEVAAKIVVIGRGDDRLGLVVDSVDEVTTVAAHDLQSPPVGDHALIDWVAQLDDRLVLVLSATGLLAA